MAEPRHLPVASLGGLEPGQQELRASVCVCMCDCEKVRKEGGAKGGALRTSESKGVGEQGKGEECVS